jgi:hypothetical protein
VQEKVRVSSRVSEKQRRRAEREAREREVAARERRSRRLRAAGTAALAVVAVAAVAALASTRGGGGGEVPKGSEGAFGAHYAGLEQRRTRAGVSTMSSPTASLHIHPQLSVWVDGKRVGVPANIGIDPRRPPGDMASLHTHTPDGVIHDEGQGNATLGQFFAVWGVPFSRDRLGPYRASGGRAVQMWVDGQPSRAFRALKLRDKQRIVVSFGRPAGRPPVS